MKFDLKWTDGYVLLLYNVDPLWQRADLDNVLKVVEQMRDALAQEGHSVSLLEVGRSDYCDILEGYDPGECVVFNWCEDLPGIRHGEIVMAEMLEKNHFCYTGSPPEVLSLTWNKALVKKILNRSRIATPHWRLFSTPQVKRWEHFPAIVKPAFEHYSNGITTESVVFDARGLSERISYVMDEFHQPALVEDFIDGRELYVTLWGNSKIEMLPPAEMDFSAFENLYDRICTFDSKFVPGSLHYEKIKLRVPADLNTKEFKKLKHTCQRAYQTIGCRDYARIDLRLQDGVFYVIDINPNADMSPDTSMAYAAGVAGMTYGSFASTLVHMAAQRHPSLSSRSEDRPGATQLTQQE